MEPKGSGTAPRSLAAPTVTSAVDWDGARRTIVCRQVGTSLEVPVEWAPKVEQRTPSDVTLRTGDRRVGVILARADAAAFSARDFARDVLDGLELLTRVDGDASPPIDPEALTLEIDVSPDAGLEGRLSEESPVPSLRRSFSLRYVVTRQAEYSCRFLRLREERRTRDSELVVELLAGLSEAKGHDARARQKEARETEGLVLSAGDDLLVDAETPRVVGAPCRGSALTLEQIWKEECQTDRPARSREEPLDIDLEITPAAAYVAGREGSVDVAFVNRSNQDSVLVFHHHCLGLRPEQMFDLEATNDRGVSAMLGGRPPIGLLSMQPCQFPYVHALLAPKGRITIRLSFVVAAERQMSQPALRPGPLAQGTYSVEVTAPLVRGALLKRTFSMNVVRR